MAESNFVDYVKILCRSGKGGAGAMHLYRAKYVPKGGPDGGDGGRGGNVYLRANRNLWTLLHLKYSRHVLAGNGSPGGANRSFGKDGEDKTIEVPCGTAVFDANTGEFLCEVTQDGEEVVLLKGGRGGLGNWHFKSATNQTPRYAQPGEPAVERTVILELKLLADIGLVGFPNVGKSTFINSLAGKTAAKTGNKPGVTRGNQWIKIDKQLELLDTPGILWPKFDDEAIGMKLACVGSISDEVLNMQEIAYHLLSYGKANYNQLFEARYGAVPQPDDERDNEIVLWMENIARQRGCLKRGAETDFDKVSAQITDDFRSGRIGKVSLEVPKQA